MDDLDSSGLNNGAAESPTGGNSKMTEQELLKKLKSLEVENCELKLKMIRTTANENADPLEGSSQNVRTAGRDSSETSLRSTVATAGISVNPLSIPECLTSEGENEIDRKSFENWKKILEASLDLMGSPNERTKMGIFKIRAGAKLLEVYESTKTSPGMPDENLEPYANAIARLNEYFGSRTYMMSQRSKLIKMVQRKDENSVQFVRRVGTATKLCGYLQEEEMETIMRVIIRGTLDSQVRKLAHRNWVRQGSLKDLIDAVEDSEIERFNEEEFMRTQKRNPVSASGAAVIAAVERYSNPTVFRQAGFSGGRQASSVKRGVNRGRRGGNSRSFSSRVPAETNNRQCWRCGGVYHPASECRMIDRVCHKCQIKGHLAHMCTADSGHRGFKRRLQGEQVSDSRTNETRRIAMVQDCDEDMDVKPEKIPKLSEKENNQPLKIAKVVAQKCVIKENDALIIGKVAGMDVEFFIDSGAQVNTVTKSVFDSMLASESSRKLIYDVRFKSDRPLKGYGSAKNIEVLATFSADLYITEDRPILTEKFYVVNEIRALLGYNTASRYSVLTVGLDVPVKEVTYAIWPCELALSDTANVNTVTESREFPKFSVPPISLKYNKNMPPSRNVYTHIPAPFKDLVKQKIDDLLVSGIIEEVNGNMDRSFCSSLLVVPKGKDDIRLVIDLRGPNKCIYRTPFKMPTFDSILMELHGSTYFSTIDLTSAYFHVELDEDSRHLTNFFAGDALYRYCRLPFGLCNAPDIFQEILQCIILKGCKGTVNYLDDVLIHGKTKEEHDENLAEVMRRLKNHNVSINLSKCALGQTSVRFLGFRVSEDGWKIEDDKIKAIQSFRPPESLAEVKSFLGLITFVEKFIHRRADKTRHLRELAKSEVFYWNQELEDEFQNLKNNAWTDTLGYFSKEDRTELYVDASPYGLGAVLVQFDGESKPRIIACASKSLTTAEKKYPHTQKEALAMVWGVERFSMHLLGNFFTIRTDAVSNEFIFNSRHRIGKRAVSRAESWALRLQPYSFEVKCIPGSSNIADALSRLVKETKPAEPFDDSFDKHLLYKLDAGIIDLSWDEIERISESDVELSKVRYSLNTGIWKEGLQRYQVQADHMRSLGSLVFKDDRIVVPERLRFTVLQSAHQGHMGIASTKRILREYFWWPGMSTEAENFVKKCSTCQQLSRKNPPIPLSMRKLPQGPWEILQIDFFTAKEFGQGEFLVIVDTYSRYLHVIEMNRMDADATIEAMDKVFLVWGYPLVIQSDNGPPFQSEKFISTWEKRGVTIRKSIPLSPQSNGAVERQNKGIKEALKAAKLDEVNWKSALSKYVHMHNKVRPISNLGVTPFELMVGWKFRGTYPCLWESSTRAPLDRTEIREKDDVYKLKTKQYADFKRGAKDSDIAVGDDVLLAQQRKLKSDPTFGSEKYSVIAREGARVVIRSSRGVQYSRNVQDVKKIFPGDDMSIFSEDKATTGESSSDIHEGTENVANEDNLSTERQDRPRREIVKPNRFKDMLLYTIFA